MCVQPNADFVQLYRESGRGDRPVQGGLKVCWRPDEAKARATMHRLWPTDAIPGEAMQLLPTPCHFGELVLLISEDMIEATCGLFQRLCVRPSGLGSRPSRPSE